MGESRIIPQAPNRRTTDLEILAEVPSTLGLVLWQDLRHVRDWAEDASKRERLFPPRLNDRVVAKRIEARVLEPELDEALAALGRLLESPTSTPASMVAEACVAVVQWAERLHLNETAMQFADAAAVTSSRDPRLANLAGRIARNAADFPRAEVWFERAIMLAREQRDRVELTRAHLGYGILCKELRRVRCAQRHFERGANLARKAGYEWLAAEAQHDLFAYLLVRGRYVAASRAARKAFALYPKHNRRLPFFAADLALLLVRTRRYDLAMRLLKPLTRLITDESAHAVILALILRARSADATAPDVDVLRRRALKALEKSGEWESVVRWHLAAAD